MIKRLLLIILFYSMALLPVSIIGINFALPVSAMSSTAVPTSFAIIAAPPSSGTSTGTGTGSGTGSGSGTGTGSTTQTDPCLSTPGGCLDTKSLPQSSLLSNPGSSTISKILTLVFSTIGAIALIIIVLAGFQYITSRGEPEKTARAKDTILYAVVGLVIAVLATTIVSFIAGYF